MLSEVGLIGPPTRTCGRSCYIATVLSYCLLMLRMCVRGYLVAPSVAPCS